MRTRNLQIEDCAKLSILHKISIPYTTSSKIGTFYLERIYRSIVKNKKNNTSYVAVEGHKLIGAICVTCNLNLFQAEIIKELTPKDYFKITKSILFLKVSPLEIIKRIIFENRLSKNYKSGYATITILFIMRDYRRKRVGSKLIKKVLSFYKKKVKNIYVDTISSNIPAIKLYKSMGFKIQKKLNDSLLLVFQNKK